MHLAGSSPPALQVLPFRAALSPLMPVLIQGIAPTQVQHLTFGLVKPHTVPMSSLPAFPGPAGWRFIPCPCHECPCSTQLDVICKFAEGALVATMSLIETVLVSIWTLRTPFLTHLHSALDRYFLDTAVQPIPYPPNSPHIKSISLQFKKKDFVRDHVKGLTE